MWSESHRLVITPPELRIANYLHMTHKLTNGLIQPSTPPPPPAITHDMNKMHNHNMVTVPG